MLLAFPAVEVQALGHQDIKNQKMNFHHIFFLLLFFSGSSLTAQSTLSIKLLDIDDNMPIVGATFEYGNQQGISDQEGRISFHLLSQESMFITHISYGSWEWTEEELSTIAAQQVFYCKNTALHLYPVTIVGLRPNQQPASNVHIDYQDRMEHDGAVILNQLPAFNSIRKSGNYGFDPVFRGYKYEQLNIVLNGAQSATAACPNRMDPPTSQMAPNMMGRVEVLKGPHALRFGTGFGATINFVPEPFHFSAAPALHGRFSSAYESNGNIFRGEGQLGFSGSKYDLSLFGAWAQGDDYQSGDGQSVQADFLRGSFGSNLGIKLTNKQQLRLSAMYNKARDVDFPALPMDLIEDDTWMFSARHDLRIDANHLQSWNTTLYASFVDHRMSNELKILDPRMLDAETPAQTQNYGARTESVWQFANNRLFAGADFRVEGAEGSRTRSFLLGPNEGKVFEDNAWQEGQITKSALFAEYHIKAASLNYVFSGRMELNQATVSDPSPEFTREYPETTTTQVNPSVSIGLLKAMGESYSLGLWLGRAQRSGGLAERFINYFPIGQDPYEMLGNPDIKPEVNNQLDINFSKKAGKLQFSINLFASYLQDNISSVIDSSFSPRLPMSPGVRQFINIDEAFKTGFEASLTQSLPLGLQQQIGIAYTYAQDLERAEPLPETPPMDIRYTLSGRFFEERLKPELAFRYVLEQSRISQEFGESATPAFALLDLQLAYDITEKIKINTGVRNVLDENYYEHLNRAVRGANAPIYAPGRNFFVNLSVSF
jgi:iron complex outermembrane receptor protein